MRDQEALASLPVGKMAGRRSLWVWRFYLLAGILATGGYFLLSSAIAQSVFTVSVDLSVVAAIAAGILVHRPSRPLPWYLLAFGSLLVLGGDAFSAIYSLGIGYPYPSLADVLYMGSIPLVIARLLLIGKGGKAGKGPT